MPNKSIHSQIFNIIELILLNIKNHQTSNKVMSLSNSSIEVIKNDGDLNLAISQSADKLVILFYYTKGNPQCKYSLKRYEDLAYNYSLAYFCMVDMDNFEDDNNGKISSITNTPFYEFYFRGNKFGSHVGSDVDQLRRKIEAGQRAASEQTSNNINMNSNNNFNQFISNPMYQNVKQILCNHARQNNPMLLSQYMQNEQFLHNAILQYMQQHNIQINPMQMGQGQMGPMGQMGQMGQMGPMGSMGQMGPMQMGQMNPMNPMQMGQMNPMQMGPMGPMQMGQPNSNGSHMSSLQNLNTALNTQSDLSQFVMPSLQQMQYIFQIWETMNQMGILKTNVPPKPLTADKAGLIDRKSSVSVAVGEGLTLPSGERIIPLGNKQYKIIPAGTTN